MSSCSSGGETPRDFLLCEAIAALPEAFQYWSAAASVASECASEAGESHRDGWSHDSQRPPADHGLAPPCLSWQPRNRWVVDGQVGGERETAEGEGESTECEPPILLRRMAAVVALCEILIAMAPHPLPPRRRHRRQQQSRARCQLGSPEPPSPHRPQGRTPRPEPPSPHCPQGRTPSPEPPSPAAREASSSLQPEAPDSRRGWGWGLGGRWSQLGSEFSWQ